MVEKMPLTSEDIRSERISRLREGFPEVFTEGKVDFEKLKQALGDEVSTDRERYGLSWAGKAEAIRNVQTPSVATLVPKREESVEFDTTENLFIEGDNLEVLKLLQKSYHGRIKMIYIDPPYNTGNEFIYPDNFREGIEDYLRYSGQMNGEGMKLSTNTETSGRYHSKWLSMMYPRLFLARNLLREDGVIFVSIDDYENHNLRTLLNEVFGEENFVESFVWKKRYGGGAKEKYIVSLHEYVICYAKDLSTISQIFVPLDPDSVERYYKYKDEKFETRGPYRLHPLEATKSVGRRDNLIYPIPSPQGGEVWPERQWWWAKERTMLALKNNELEFVKGKNGISVQTKQYLRDEEGIERQTKPFSIIDDVYTQHGTAEIADLFEDSRVFPFPKPTGLLNKLLVVPDFEDGDIVVDLFAGSGTTAHAILDLNNQDGINRKFIMVQLPEPTESPDYPTIVDIGKERIRRVIEKLNEEENGKLKVEGTLQQDRGFKVFKLTSSNFKIWDGAKASKESEDMADRLWEFAENVLPDRSQEDILYEILLKSGFSLTAQVERLELARREVYSVSGGLLFICLEDHVDEELMREVAQYEPERFVCLDSAFNGNDKLKTNTKLQMEDRRIEFRTV